MLVAVVQWVENLAVMGRMCYSRGEQTELIGEVVMCVLGCQSSLNYWWVCVTESMAEVEVVVVDQRAPKACELQAFQWERCCKLMAVVIEGQRVVDL